MNNNLDVKLHNRFDMQLINSSTGEVKQIAKAENVVCNGYWTVLFTASYSINCVNIGTGTGTPSVTDTGLFRYLSYKDVYWTVSNIDKNNWKAIATITLSENEWNGDLTEVGLSYDRMNYSGSILCTHALFTDSEGNPIIIHKTNADRLTLTITLYLTMTWTAPHDNLYFSPWVRNYRTAAINVDPRIDYVQGDGYWTSLINWLLCKDSSISGYNLSLKYLPSTIPIIWTYHDGVAINFNEAGIGTSTITYNSSSDTVRLQVSARILSTSGNSRSPSTHLIKCIESPYIAAFVSLPNEQVYPSRQLTLAAIADGTTTDFNFGIPELRTSDVEVYIDDVKQASNTYTFFGRDYTHPQGWKSYDTTYLSTINNFDRDASGQQTGSYLHRPAPVCIYTFYMPSNVNTLSEFVYDFKTPYKVSGVGMYRSSAWDSYIGAPQLYYSDDGESWAELSNIWSDYRNQVNINEPGGIITVTPVVARYWKVLNPRNRLTAVASVWGSTQGTYDLVASILFDDPKPQLRFNTAPPANATVKIKAYCDYPIKNSNWIIENGMTFDYTFTRQ